MCTSGTVEQIDKALLRANRNGFMCVDGSGGSESNVSLMVETLQCMTSVKRHSTRCNVRESDAIRCSTMLHRFVWRTAKQRVHER